MISYTMTCTLVLVFVNHDKERRYKIFFTVLKILTKCVPEKKTTYEPMKHFRFIAAFHSEWLSWDTKRQNNAKPLLYLINIGQEIWLPFHWRCFDFLLMSKSHLRAPAKAEPWWESVWCCSDMGCAQLWQLAVSRTMRENWTCYCLYEPKRPETSAGREVVRINTVCHNNTACQTF